MYGKPEAASSSDELLQVTDLSSMNFEYEQGKSQSVKGNLKRNISFWQAIATSKFIFDVIERGYKSESVLLENNKSAEKHAGFVGEAILELVNSGRIIQVSTAPRVVNLLSVSVQASGKERLILDLRHVNMCLSKKKVKYEDWNIA